MEIITIVFVIQEKNFHITYPNKNAENLAG
jgi:hypothetical protein